MKTRRSLAMVIISMLILFGIGMSLLSHKENTRASRTTAARAHAASPLEEAVPQPARWFPWQHKTKPAARPVPVAAEQEEADETIAMPAGDSPEDGPPALPVALAEPAVSFGFDDDQFSTLDGLREEFIAAINGARIEGSSASEYRTRWEQAREEMDERFRTQFGEEALNLQVGAAADMRDGIAEQ